jgi:hypothetical protein
MRERKLQQKSRWRLLQMKHLEKICNCTRGNPAVEKFGRAGGRMPPPTARPALRKPDAVIGLNGQTEKRPRRRAAPSCEAMSRRRLLIAGVGSWRESAPSCWTASASSATSPSMKGKRSSLERRRTVSLSDSFAATRLEACTHKSRLFGNRWLMSALPPKAAV